MKIILSPAKKMRTDQDGLDYKDLPQYLDQATEILAWLQGHTHEELKSLWKCNDAIAQQNFERLERMAGQLKPAHLQTSAGLQPSAAPQPSAAWHTSAALLTSASQLTPAVLAYDGIAYQYMAPAVFDYDQLDYIQDHLRILSAFYGALRPMDGVVPYRLEMGCKFVKKQEDSRNAEAEVAAEKGGENNRPVSACKDLYEFWGSRLYDAVRDESGIIINLASKEYFKAVQKYLTPSDRFITITFCEEVKGKLVTKGTYAKMARGDMVRYMAENRIEEPERLKKYDRMNYHFRDDLSSEGEYVFERRMPDHILP